MKYTSDDLDEQLLPPLARECVEAIGLELALRLIARHGGQRIYVPKEAEPDHWLSELIGQDAARKLGKTWGTNFIVLPLALAALRGARNRRFLRLLDEGSSISNAARAAGLTRRLAFEIQAQERLRRKGAGAHQPDAPQMRLFEKEK